MDATLHSFAYCLDYLRDQVADLTDEEMVAQPAGVANHPAWVIGHITCSCMAIGGQIGLDSWLPDDWAKRYGTGSQPASDTNVYESKAELLSYLSDAQNRISTAIQSMTPEELASPLPEVRYRPILPTVRHALVQMLVAHTATHIGQLTIWRNQMGLPPLDRHFL